MKKLIMIWISLLLMAGFTFADFGLDGFSKMNPYGSWDPRNWDDSYVITDTSFFLQKYTAVYDDPSDATVVWTLYGSGFIEGFQYIMRNNQSGLVNMADSVWLMVFEKNEINPRWDLPIPMLGNHHFNSETSNNDAIISTAAGASDSLLSLDNFWTFTNHVASSKHYLAGGRFITIPFVDSFRVEIRSTYHTTGNIDIYLGCWGRITPKSDIENLDVFRHVNTADTAFLVDSDTICIYGPNYPHIPFFSLTGPGVLHEFMWGIKSTHGYDNVLEDSIKITVNGITYINASSYDDYGNGWWYSAWNPPVFGSQAVGMSVYYRESNKPRYLFYRYYHPYCPVPFSNTASIEVVPEQFGNHDQWTIALDADLESGDTLSCDIEGDSIGVVYATSHLNTMNLMDAAITAHDSVESVTVGGTGNRTLTINSIQCIEALLIENAQVDNAGGTPPNVTATDVNTSRIHEKKAFLIWYSRD